MHLLAVFTVICEGTCGSPYLWQSFCTQDRGTSLASNQVQYSLLYRAPESNGVKQACEEGGTSLVAYSPLAQGLLTGQSIQHWILLS